MSEEDVIREEPEEVSEVVEPVVEEPQFSEVEQKAREMGWKPKSEFDNPNKEFISADEYIRNQSFFERINDLTKQNQASRHETKQLQRQIEKLTNMVASERKRGYEQALADTAAKRREAFEVGDIDAFDKFDSHYNAIKEEQYKFESDTVPNAPVPEISPEELEFQERNLDWFNTNTPENSSMVNQAISIASHLQNTEPYLTNKQILKNVEDKIKNLYPHRFENSKKKAPVAVETSSVKSSPKPGGLDLRVEDLTENQRKVMDEFLKLDPTKTKQDYLRGLQESLRKRGML